MKTYAQSEAARGLFEASMQAVSKLKERPAATIRAGLSRPRRDYPVRDRRGRGERVEFVPLFPHLVLPDLVEAHIAQLGLQPIFIEPDKAVAPPALTERREHRAHAPGASLCITHPRSGSNLLAQSGDVEILRLEFQSGSL